MHGSKEDNEIRQSGSQLLVKRVSSKKMVLSKLHVIASRPSIQKLLKIGKTVFSPRYLLYTNVLVSAHLAAFGDVVQQTYQHSKPEKITETWDPKRTTRMFGAGFCLSPFVHFWYLNLDKFLPGNTIKIAVTKLIPDLFLFSPTYILLFLLVTGILEGQNWKSYTKEVRDKGMGLFSVEIFLWTPAQFINFYFLPTRFRVLYDNSISLVADVLYSYFRFDFDPDKDEEASAADIEKNKLIDATL